MGGSGDDPNKQLMYSGGPPIYQPSQPGGPFFGFDCSPLPPMSTPWLAQQPSSHPDSGFYSPSSARTEGDSFTNSHQAFELGYPPPELADVQTPVEGQTFPVPTQGLLTGRAGPVETFDMDRLISWEGNGVQTLKIGEKRASSTENADGTE